MTINLNVTVTVNFPKPLEVVVKGDGNAEELEKMRAELHNVSTELKAATAAANPPPGE